MATGRHKIKLGYNATVVYALQDENRQIIGRLAIGPVPGKVKDIYQSKEVVGENITFTRVDRKLLIKHVQQLRREKWDTLVCLLPESELLRLGVPDYVKIVSKYIKVIYLPIRDGCPPSIEKAASTIPYLSSLLAQGSSVIIHCRCGLGRAGTVAASTLLHYNISVGNSMKMVRSSRPGAIQTLKQEAFLHQYAKLSGF